MVRDISTYEAPAIAAAHHLTGAARIGAVQHLAKDLLALNSAFISLKDSPKASEIDERHMKNS